MEFDYKKIRTTSNLIYGKVLWGKSWRFIREYKTLTGAKVATRRFYNSHLQGRTFKIEENLATNKFLVWREEPPLGTKFCLPANLEKYLGFKNGKNL